MISIYIPAAVCTKALCAGAGVAQRMAVAGEPLMETAVSTTTRDIPGLALLAMLDALGGEPREDERDAVPLVPFQRLAAVLARRSVLFSSTTAALRRAFH